MSFWGQFDHLMYIYAGYTIEDNTHVTLMLTAALCIRVYAGVMMTDAPSSSNHPFSLLLF